MDLDQNTDMNITDVYVMTMASLFLIYKLGKNAPFPSFCSSFYFDGLYNSIWILSLLSFLSIWAFQSLNPIVSMHKMLW